MKRKLIVGLFLGMFSVPVMGQFTYGTTGLLHMPTADMQKDKTLLFGGGLLSKHATPSRWNYNTWNYYVNVTFLPWLEVGYTCTMFDEWIYEGELHMVNQDRSFHGRLRLWKEGWWKAWTPQIVAGVNDATTGAGGDYTEMGVKGDSNGYLNRYYVAATKHFDWYGQWGVHAAYLYNKRISDKLNGPAFGVDYRFALTSGSLWSQALNGLNLMGEYDSEYVNVGAKYSLWKERINLVGELRKCRYPSVGLYFKVVLF